MRNDSSKNNVTITPRRRCRRIHFAVLCAGAFIGTLVLSNCAGGGGTGPGGARTGSITVTGDSVAMSGYIQTVTAGKKELVVYDRVVKLHPQTKIEGDGGIPLTFEDLIVGMWAKIDGRVDKENNGTPPPTAGDNNGRVKVIADEIFIDTNDDGDPGEVVTTSVP